MSWRNISQVQKRLSIRTDVITKFIRFSCSSTTGKTNPTSPQNNSHSSIRGPRPPPVLRTAIDDLNSLEEVQQAALTADAAIRETLLSRVLGITSRSASTNDQPRINSGDEPLSKKSANPHTAIAHLLLARHAHGIGDISTERAHRIQALEHLTHVASRDAENVVAHHHVLSSAHAALSLACLRAHGAEMRLAASAAADEANTLAVTPRARTAATLLSALSATSSKRTLLLSALTALSPDSTEDVSNSMDDTDVDGPDVTGYARYFLARDATERIKADDARPTQEGQNGGSLRGNSFDTLDGPSALDHALALVVRWDGGGHDLCEALVQAAETCYVVQKREGFAQAEDLLSRAVQEARLVGTEADEAGGLLGLAQLFSVRGAVIEAEGFFRAAEERLIPMWKRKAFTVPAAHIFCKMCDSYADFLDHMTVDGRARSTEVRQKRDMAQEIREMFPQVLLPNSTTTGVHPLPSWFVQSLMPHFDLDLPI